MSKERVAAFVGLAVLPVLLALWLAGFDVSYQLGNYVVSDSAHVAGEVYHASAPASGQIIDLLLDVGDPVEKGQGVASLVALAPSQAAPMAPRITASVRSPAPGTVLHLNVARGQSVSAGQSVATLADLSSLWVVASVDETSFKKIQPGMPAEVRINALDRSFNGQVIGVLPDIQAPAAGGARPASPNAARPIPQVPVRIAFDYGDATIYPGMTADVKIFVRS